MYNIKCNHHPCLRQQVSRQNMVMFKLIDRFFDHLSSLVSRYAKEVVIFETWCHFPIRSFYIVCWNFWWALVTLDTLFTPAHAQASILQLFRACKLIVISVVQFSRTQFLFAFWIQITVVKVRKRKPKKKFLIVGFEPTELPREYCLMRLSVTPKPIS